AKLVTGVQTCALPIYEEAVVAEDHVADGVIAAQPAGGVDLDVVGAEDDLKSLLHDERDAPGGEQALERAAVEELDDAPFQDQTEIGRASCRERVERPG